MQGGATPTYQIGTPGIAFVGSSSNAQTLAIVQPNRSLIIACGSGSVSISMETGSVTFKDCEPNEAGRKFWESVARMYPTK